MISVETVRPDRAEHPVTLTPAAQKFFNVIPTDIGRSLNDLKINLEVADLDQMILEVIETLHLQECEVRDRRGHWHSLRIRPYVTLENNIDGASIVLLEVDSILESVGGVRPVRYSSSTR